MSIWHIQAMAHVYACCSAGQCGSSRQHVRASTALVCTMLVPCARRFLAVWHPRSSLLGAPAPGGDLTENRPPGRGWTLGGGLHTTALQLSSTHAETTPALANASVGHLCPLLALWHAGTLHACLRMQCACRMRLGSARSRPPIGINGRRRRWRRCRVITCLPV